MNRELTSRQCSIQTLMILTLVAAACLVVFRAFLVHGDLVLAGVVILAIPTMMLTIVMHVAMLGFAQVASMLPSFKQKPRSRADTVQH